MSRGAPRPASHHETVCWVTPTSSANATWLRSRALRPRSMFWPHSRCISFTERDCIDRGRLCQQKTSVGPITPLELQSQEKLVCAGRQAQEISVQGGCVGGSGGDDR